MLIRGAYFLPAMATLGNALCGFAAMYVVTLDPLQSDAVARFLADNRFLAAVYLILGSMVLDALDGRLARMTRQTSDFGGQLDSLSDAISFGAAPALIALHVFKADAGDVPQAVGRLVFALGLIYVACAVIRLARFNVTNEHDEQHHMSFLGLPSPAAAAAVLGLVLIQRELSATPSLYWLWVAATWLVPAVLIAAGLLMVSTVRYPHVVNRLLRGRKSLGTLVATVALLVLLVVEHRYVLGTAGLIVAASGPLYQLRARLLRKRARPTLAA